MLKSVSSSTAWLSLGFSCWVHNTLLTSRKCKLFYWITLEVVFWNFNRKFLSTFPRCSSLCSVWHLWLRPGRMNFNYFKTNYKNNKYFPNYSWKEFWKQQKISFNAEIVRDFHSKLPYCLGQTIMISAWSVFHPYKLPILYFTGSLKTPHTLLGGSNRGCLLLVCVYIVFSFQ